MGNKGIYDKNSIIAGISKELKSTFPHLKKYNIRNILREYHEHLLDIITSERCKVMLPEFTGDIFVGTRLVDPNSEHEQKFDKIVEMTVESGKNTKPRSLNETDGYRPRLYYSVLNSKRFNHGSKWWGLEPTAKTRKKVYDRFVEDRKLFVIVPDVRKMRTVFQKQVNKTKMVNKQNELLKTYDEYDFSEDE